MNTLLTTMVNLFIVRFCAGPNHSMHSSYFPNDVLVERLLQKLKASDPGFPRDDPPPEMPTRPARPFPTDVPAPSPHDVPAPEPFDVPPPEPGEVPNPAKQSPRPKQDPKPRPIP